MLNDINPADACINLDDTSAEVACIVNKSYGGEEYEVDGRNLLDCSRMAEKYDMPRLQKAVNDFISQLDLSPENLPGYLAMAHEHAGLDQLKKKCMRYTVRRLQQIIDTRYVLSTMLHGNEARTSWSSLRL